MQGATAHGAFVQRREGQVNNLETRNTPNKTLAAQVSTRDASRMAIPMEGTMGQDNLQGRSPAWLLLGPAGGQQSPAQRLRL
jgi:hypothetical protein